MSDPNEWIKERRRIHDAATDGSWVQDEQDGVRGVDLYTNTDAEEFDDRWERQDADIGTTSADDATFIVDAHATLPSLLTALEKVLEMHTRIVTDQHVDGPTAICEQCSEDRMFALWPCETVEAIEGAIRE